MAEIRENYMAKDRSFGGRMGSKKTLWVAFVVIVAAAAMGAFYMFPQYF